MTTVPTPLAAPGPPYGFIRDKLATGKVIPFLGSGASLGMRPPIPPWKKGVGDDLPSAGELAGHLAVMMDFPAGESLDLAKVAQYFDLRGGRGDLDDELREIFTCAAKPMSMHRYLAQVPCPLLIITTNYDDLLEQAFDSRGREYDLVVHTQNPKLGDHLLWTPAAAKTPVRVTAKRLDLDLASATIIYKMHGAVARGDQKLDQYVITEDDYIDFLTKLTRNSAIPHVFAEPMADRHFLFLGYGLYDWNLRVVFSQIQKRRDRDRASWGIQFRPRPLEQLFWSKRGVQLFDMTIEEFAIALQSARI